MQAGIFVRYLYLFMNLYLEYPPNNSSPPSPDKATFTFCFVKEDNKYVGIAEASANGSSKINGSLSITEIKSFFVQVML